jgi:hypothetical protein
MGMKKDILINVESDIWMVKGAFIHQAAQLHLLMQSPEINH